MYKLPLEEGTWSGKIIFQSSKGFNVNQKATCLLEVEQSKKETKANGKIRTIDEIKEYKFSFFVTSFEAPSNMTPWQYKDSGYGIIWGKLVVIEESYLILGISEDNEYSFTLSIEAIDTTYIVAKGFTLYDRKNILSWSLHLKKIETAEVTGSKKPNESLKSTAVSLRGTVAS